jgi:hypothetical protein
MHQFSGPSRSEIGAGQCAEDSCPSDQEQLAAVLLEVVVFRPVGKCARYFAVTSETEILYCARGELSAPMPGRNSRRRDCALIVEVST